MATIDVLCAHCNSGKHIVRNSKAPSGLQRYFCRDCRKSFQTEFIYNANKPGIRDQIVEMAINGSGVRDTGRILDIRHTTIISRLKNWNPTKVTSLPFENVRIEILCEMYEQWSFVGNKKNQKWLFYA